MLTQAKPCFPLVYGQRWLPHQIGEELHALLYVDRLRDVILTNDKTSNSLMPLPIN